MDRGTACETVDRRQAGGFDARLVPMSDAAESDAGIDADALASWIVPRLGLGEAAHISGFAPPRSGYSAETTIFTLADGDDESRYVVRRETPEPSVYPQQGECSVEVELQYRVMHAVAEHGDVPIAPLVGFEPDSTLLGGAFFVMGCVDGEVPVEDPPYTREGFYADATPEQRTTMTMNGVDTMASVHAIDWRAAGLDWLAPPGAVLSAERQLDIWEAYTRAELRERVLPVFERGLGLLRGRIPAPTEPVLNWGDPRPGNIIWQDFEPICVTDFEAACLAPAEVDLGWWLMFDHWSHETMGVDHLPGAPSREDQLARYESQIGRPVVDIAWYEIFAAVRYCGIVARIMNRWVERGLLPEDQTIWRDNPASACLELLLDR